MHILSRELMHIIASILWRILHNRKKVLVITRQWQAAEVLSMLSTMNVPLVITKQLVVTKQLKLYFNNSSRIPTLAMGSLV
jgi:hypothetical protein